MHPIKATVQDTTRSSNRIKNENQPTSLVTRIDNLEIKELSKPKDSEIHLKDKKFKKCHPEHSPSEIASLPMLPLGDLPKDASHSSVEESRGRHGRSPKQKTSLSPPRFKTSISPKRSKGSSVTKQSFDHLTSSGGSESPSRSGSEPRTPPSRQSSPRTPVSTPDYPRYKPPSPLLSGSTGDNPLNIQEQKISLPPFTGPLLDAASLVSNAIRNSTSGNICRFEVLLDSDAITLDNELRVLLFKIIDKIRNKQSDFLSAEESWHSHSIDKIMRAFTNPHMSFERYKKKAHIAAGQIYYEATETSNLKQLLIKLR